MLGSNGNLIENSNNQKLVKEVGSNNEKIGFNRQSDNFYTATTSELNPLHNLELHEENNVINTSTMNKLDEEEDFSILPNDTIEYNNMDDLVDFFNSNDKTGYSDHELHHHAHHHHHQHFKNQMNITSPHQTQPNINQDFSWLMNNSAKNQSNYINENFNNSNDRYLLKMNIPSSSNEPKGFNKNTSGTNNNNVDVEQNK